MQATIVHSARRTFMSRRPLFMSIAVLAWSTKSAVSLAFAHTAGAELYGLLTALIAVAAAIGNLLIVVRYPRTPGAIVGVLIAVWVLVALAGMGGVVAHIVGPVAGHGAIDPRPRPVLAPLVFTALGSVGALALALAYRMRARVLHR